MQHGQLAGPIQLEDRPGADASFVGNAIEVAR